VFLTPLLPLELVENGGEYSPQGFTGKDGGSMTASETVQKGWRYAFSANP